MWLVPQSLEALVHSQKLIGQDQRSRAGAQNQPLDQL